MTTGSIPSYTVLISFNKKNTKAKIYWDKGNEPVYDNDFKSDNDPLIGKFKVTKSVAKKIWGWIDGKYSWSGMFSINKKGKLSIDFDEHGVMKGKIGKKSKDFYSAAASYRTDESSS